MTSKSLEYYIEKKDEFEKLYALYEQYNSHTNISAIRNKQDVIQKHFIDSLELMEHKLIPDKMKVLDLGSGGGFPVLPLALVLPQVNFCALDSTAKKTKFIQIAKDDLNLNNLEILTGRAEDFAHQELYRENFDFVLARAVAQLNVLLELSSGFIKKDGLLCAYKNLEIQEEEEESYTSQQKTNLIFETKYLVADDRQILVFRKKQTLDSKLPRQFSQIRAKPL
jgi:16S rRNA (guanine527-N7)-methyltransferase